MKRFQISNEPWGYVVEVYWPDWDGIERWLPLRNFGDRQGDALSYRDIDCPDLDTPYGDLFTWHHTLTGSCEFGRKEWCKAHGYQPTDSITVRTFIEQTKNDYGSDAIRMLAERYAIKFDN